VVKLFSGSVFGDVLHTGGLRSVTMGGGDVPFANLCLISYMTGL